MNQTPPSVRWIPAAAAHQYLFCGIQSPAVTEARNSNVTPSRAGPKRNIYRGSTIYHFRRTTWVTSLATTYEWRYKYALTACWVVHFDNHVWFCHNLERKQNLPPLLASAPPGWQTPTTPVGHLLNEWQMMCSGYYPTPWWEGLLDAANLRSNNFSLFFHRSTERINI